MFLASQLWLYVRTLGFLVERPIRLVPNPHPTEHIAPPSLDLSDGERQLFPPLLDWAAVRFGTEFDDAAEVLAVEDCDEDDEGQ